ncbi:MAG: hypothetical protein ACI9FD_004563 [Gammaproteobacteria bacterium]|jgi:hypothetical protein
MRINMESNMKIIDSNRVRNLSIVFVALQLFAGNSIADSVGNEPEAVADGLHAALVAGNAEKVHELLDPQVLIFESGNVEQSLEEYASHHMHSDMEFMAAIQREVISRKVIQSDDIAVVSTRSRLTGTFGGKEIDINSTETLVLGITDQGWKIRHIHWSSS